MSLLGSVWNTIKGAEGDAVDLGKRVWHAIDGVYTFLRGILLAVGGAWTKFYNSVRAVDAAIIHGAISTYEALKWLATKAVPGVGNWALRKGEHLATAAVNKAYKLALKEVGKARSFVLHEIRVVDHWAVGEFKAVRKDIAKDVRWIEHDGAKIAGLVLHPDKLAAYLVKALLGPLVHLLLTGSEDLLVDLLKGFRRHEAEAAHTLEDVLHKFL